MLDPSFTLRFADTLEAWASHHPLADQALVDIAASDEGDVAVSPRDIAVAFRHEEHPLHRSVVRMFEVGLSGYHNSPEKLADQLIAALEEDLDEFRAKGG